MKTEEKRSVFAGVPDSLTGSGPSALRRWRAAIVSAPETTPVQELGAAGLLLSRDLRGTADPVFVQLVDRIIRATQEPVYNVLYTTRFRLLEDIDALLRYTTIPASRKPAFEWLVQIVRGTRTGPGRSAVVTGESGIGKTFLWQEFQRSCATADEMWVSHKSPQVGEVPYAGYGAILDQLLARTAAALHVDSGELVSRLVLTEPVSGSGAWVISSLLSEVDTDLHAPPSTDHATSEATAAALAAALRIVATWARSAGVGAVVIAVDDVQWADRQSMMVWRSLVGDPGKMALILMTRPQLLDADSAFQAAPTVSLEPLTPFEAQTLKRALVVPTSDTDALLPPDASTGSDSGNPFRIVQGAREALQIRGLEAPEPQRLDKAHDRTTVQRQLHQVSSAAQAIIDTAALLLPPVPQDAIMAALDISAAELASGLRECRELGILVVQSDAVTFSHDRLESAARIAALHSGRWTATAARILVDRALAGDLRGTYILARLIAGSDRTAREQEAIPAESFLSPKECVWILHTAATRAIHVAAATEAARFVSVAIEKCGQSLPESELVGLLHIGHRAAFLRDDAHAMSHYYRELTRYGSWHDLVVARQQWISRCYAKLLIRGAVRIGKNILKSYDATRDLTVEDARALLRRWRPSRVYRRIMEHPEDTRSESLLVARTCAGLLLPVMSIDHQATYLFAAVILRHSMASGPTPYTPFGFLYWAMATELDSRSPRRRESILQLAQNAMRAIPTDGLSPEEVNRIRVFVGIIGHPWDRLSPFAYSHLFTLYREGRACGSFETSAHAIHVYCYAPLFHGYPLRQVYRTIEHYRSEVTSHGLTRISRAMGKFAQAALVLMGETEKPTEVSGHICSEDELTAELTRTGDSLGLAGLRFLRALLAVYHGSAELALKRLRTVEEETALVRFLIDVTWSWFMHAMIAWRLGLVDEALEFGRRLRTVSDSAPGDHRYAAVRAEHLNHLGFRRTADRTFRTAAERAVANGHTHDAALIVERHAHLLLDRAPDSASTIERLHVAESLYERWGARRKVGEMRAHIERYRVRAGQVLDGVIPAYAPSPDPDNPGPPPEERHSAELTAAREALAHTQEYTRILLSSVDDALLLARTDGSVLFHNAGAASFTITSAPDEWQLEPELLRGIGGIRNSGEGETQWHSRTLRYAMRSVARGRNPEAVAVVIRDITAERDRERRLLVADRLSSLGMLAATVAHEVGNPNHIISLHAQALATSASTPAQQEAIERILEGTGRIDDVVRLITRYGHDSSQTAPRWADPVEIGSRVGRFTQIMAQQYTAHLEFVHEETVPPFWGYPALVEQALINLVKNSCEALTSRDQRVCIRVTEQESCVLFQVCDQGIGFTAGSSGKPFPGEDIFATTKSQSGGTGLGISVVRSIADRHGGSLRYTHSEVFSTIAELRIPVEAV